MRHYGRPVMRTSLWAYAAVTVLSVGAGVAIAGIPGPGSDLDAGAPDVSNTVAPADTVDSESSVAATQPATTLATTTTTVAPATTLAPATTAEPAVTDPTTTNAPTTTISPVTTTLPPRDALAIVVANGAGFAGVAGRTAAVLEELGYVDVRTLDGDEIFGASVIYAGAGLQDVAQRLATDLGIDPALVFPLPTAPGVSGLDDEQLLAYMGADADTLER